MYRISRQTKTVIKGSNMIAEIMSNIVFVNDWNDCFRKMCIKLVEEYFDNDKLSKVKNNKKVQVQKVYQDFVYLTVLLHVQIMFRLLMDSNLMMYERLIRIDNTKTNEYLIKNTKQIIYSLFW
jgi:hypothetical protein